MRNGRSFATGIPVRGGDLRRSVFPAYSHPSLPFGDYMRGADPASTDLESRGRPLLTRCALTDSRSHSPRRSPYTLTSPPPRYSPRLTPPRALHGFPTRRERYSVGRRHPSPGVEGREGGLGNLPPLRTARRFWNPGSCLWYTRRHVRPSVGCVLLGGHRHPSGCRSWWCPNGVWAVEPPRTGGVRRG